MPTLWPEECVRTTLKRQTEALQPIMLSCKELLRILGEAAFKE